MTINVKFALPLLAAGLLAACAGGPRDTLIDNHPLQTLEAKLWVDPNGCEHWRIDDGIEGYMTPRLNPDGTPRCN